jgi:hypothetical protein
MAIDPKQAKGIEQERPEEQTNILIKLTTTRKKEKAKKTKKTINNTKQNRK